MVDLSLSDFPNLVTKVIFDYGMREAKGTKLVPIVRSIKEIHNEDLP